MNMNPLKPLSQANFSQWSKSPSAFGGSLLKGAHPKKKRPFNKSLPLHIVMCSSSAQGSRSLLRFNSEIENIVTEQAFRNFIKIYCVANGGNHLHLVVQAPSKEYLAKFLKALAGRVAQLVGGKDKEKAHESLAKHFGGKFWDARPFSRLVEWGREFKDLCSYLGLDSTNATLGLARLSAKQMFKEIDEAPEQGWIVMSPSLEATGFEPK